MSVVMCGFQHISITFQWLFWIESKCAREHNTKFKRYHAVIIQSLPENGAHIACKDATALESLFTSLNYHEVVVIRSQNANKRTIKCALRRMSLNKRNDVVVICYTGHG
eukprot:329837_1